tara:strand:+ start:64191 stop:66689 length:2499 start_codon:yes stop_codon:yes gene_type:complete
MQKELFDEITGATDWLGRELDYTYTKEGVAIGWENALTKTDAKSKFLMRVDSEHISAEKKLMYTKQACHSLYSRMITGTGRNAKIVFNEDFKSYRVDDLLAVTIEPIYTKDVTFPTFNHALDPILGYFVHEMAHFLYTTDIYPNYIKQFKGGEQKIKATLMNLLEDERIEMKIAKSFRGYTNYLGKAKEYCFGLRVDNTIDEQLDELVKQQSSPLQLRLNNLMSTFIMFLRYPRGLKREDVEEFEPELRKCMDILTPFPEDLAELPDKVEAIYDVFRGVVEDAIDEAKQEQQQQQQQSDGSQPEQDEQDNEEQEGTPQSGGQDGGSGADGSEGSSSGGDSDSDSEIAEEEDSNSNNSKEDTDEQNSGKEDGSDSEESSNKGDGDEDEGTNGEETSGDGTQGNGDELSEHADRGESAEESDEGDNQDGSNDGEQDDDSKTDKHEGDGSDEQASGDTQNGGNKSDEGQQSGNIDKALQGLDLDNVKPEDVDKVLNQALGGLSDEVSEDINPEITEKELVKALANAVGVKALRDINNMDGEELEARLSKGAHIYPETENLRLSELSVKFIDADKVTDYTKQEYRDCLSKVKPFATSLRAKLQQLNRNHTYYNKGLHEGDFDESRIVEAIFGSQNVFHEKRTVINTGAVIGLLADESGSMSGDNIRRAREISILFERALEGVNKTDFYCYGHTTNRDDDTEIRRYYTGRNLAGRHALGGMQARGTNRDGHAILEVVADMRAKVDKRTPIILFMLSDGYPSASVPYGYDGVSYTRKASKVVQKYMNTTVIHIAIEEDIPSQDMFDVYVEFSDQRTLVKDVGGLLKKIMLKQQQSVVI